MPIHFDTNALPTQGSIVLFSRRPDEDSALAELQRFRLFRVDSHTTKAGEPSAILNWRSDCTDCAASYKFKTGLSTANFYRRCKKCRSGRTTGGWTHGPRILHTLLPSESASPLSIDADEAPLALFNALPSGERLLWMRLVKGELGKDTPFEAVAAEVQRRLVLELIADDDVEEIDPASLF